ncbi:MAG: Gmad2 immunoglobulin-like domain-containing protein [Candidatus Paceibacterota bacterium]|jgi:hypothetical protein
MNIQKILFAIIFIAIAGAGGWYLFQQFSSPSSAMNLEEARSIALISQCSEKGAVSSEGAYNPNSETWWFDLAVKDEFKQEGCNPACVVFEETKNTEINWRCTGVKPPKDDLIRVSSPKTDQVVKSPLSIEGEARGTWYFEASFPIQIVDANGNVLGTAVAQAQSDWMTEDFVPFKAQLSFSTPSTERGTLILKKDNPSGLAENDDELQIPVLFDMNGLPQRIIDLYYYNSSKDQDASGNIMCSKNGLEPVERSIPLTKTPIQDAIKLLLKGELTSQELAQGITTEYPLPGLELKGASLENKVLTLTFADPQNKTGGGSCRVGILWFQIEATAKQFAEVSSVRFMPEKLFQP